MKRPITLFTSQWTNLPLAEVASIARECGFDGLEIACWGGHFDVHKALNQDGYIQSVMNLLGKYNLKCYALSNMFVGQVICDQINEFHRQILPEYIWAEGNPEKIRERAIQELCFTAQAAKLMGVSVVNGFTGSSNWPKLYFPRLKSIEIQKGYEKFAEVWLPILDIFQKENIYFGLEVSPAEIAYDIYTAQATLEAIHYHPSFCFCFDPGHFIHQFIDPILFIREFPERIVHVHVKDIRLNLDGRSSLLTSHLPSGDYRRGWNEVCPGQGDVNWNGIIRELNRIKYQGPLSLEWKDNLMDRLWGTKESVHWLEKYNYPEA